MHLFGRYGFAAIQADAAKFCSQQPLWVARVRRCLRGPAGFVLGLGLRPVGVLSGGSCAIKATDSASEKEALQKGSDMHLPVPGLPATTLALEVAGWPAKAPLAPAAGGLPEARKPEARKGA